MKSATRPILSVLRRRLYSSQAAEQVQSSLSKEGPQVSRLPNGVIVASVDNLSPVTRLATIYNAGARYEDGYTEGLTHAIRSAANLSSEKRTGFSLVKHVSQLGGSLACSTTREHMMYSMDCRRDALSEGVHLLADASTHPAFYEQELHEMIPNLELDLAMLTQRPDAAIMEAIHSAAFRGGLGNSLYMPEHTIGTHTPDMLKAFTSKYYVPSNMAVVGVGVDHETLVHLVRKEVGHAQAPVGSAAEATKSKYLGGESRIKTNNSLVHAAVVTESVSLGSKEMLALGVLQQVMGTGPHIKYSNNMNSKVNQIVAQVATSPFSATTINVNYSDTGLFGFYVVAQSSDMGKALKAIVTQVSAMTKGALAEADVTKGKNQLKSAINMSLENSENMVEDLGIQALLTGQLLDATTINSEIDKVTAADVQNIAKKVINGKPSMAAVGDLTRVPYLDELLA